MEQDMEKESVGRGVIDKIRNRCDDMIGGETRCQEIDD